MTRKENVMAVLQGMGYAPTLDEDNDIVVRYQLKTVVVYVDDEDDSNYVVVVLAQIADVKQGEESVNLAVCNKMTRELRLIKVYVDSDFQSVSATCEFYYTDNQSLENNLKKAFEMTGIVRGQFIQNREEMLR